MPAMNSALQDLQAYPFQRLLSLKDGISPPEDKPHIALSIGEPKHTPPQFVMDELVRQLSALSQYPLTKGIDELREAISQWACKRFKLKASDLSAQHHVLPVAGTREALFSFVQACVSASQGATVVMPNPFYQIYEGAAILAGAKPYFLNCEAHNNFIPDFDQVPKQVWQECKVLFLCSPGNPTGAVMTTADFKKLIALADEHDFIIASDECYSELYFDESKPPVGLLQVCAELGRNDFARCVVFHSLSKRSNLPGLRSGFVAGDAKILEQYLLYRTYQGCALPMPTQLASICAWRDESHVQENRLLYKRKFDRVVPIFNSFTAVTMPEASFYLWLATPIDDREFAQRLFAQQNVTVLPGQFLARPTAAGNPGTNYVRIALVASERECIDAAKRIKEFYTQNF